MSKEHIMKTLLFSTVLLCILSLPAFAELTPEDLDKIRLIVNEVVDKKISESEKRMKEYMDIRFNAVNKRFDDFKDSVNKRFDDVNKRFDDVNKDFDHANNLTYALIALIVVAVGIPQILIASRWRKDVQLEKQVQTLTQEVENLKQQRIVNP